VVEQGPKIRLGQFASAIHRANGKIVDNDDVVSGIVLLRKGADSDSVLEGDPRQGEGTEHGILPHGVKVVPFLDRSDLVHYTTHTVLHNLTEGIILVVVILFLFLGNVRGALIVALTIPFSLLFAPPASAQRHSGESAVAGRARFRHGGGWRGGDGGKHRAPPPITRGGQPERRWRRSARRRMKCSGRCSTPSASSSPPICRSSRCSAWKAAVQADGLDGGVRAAGRADVSMLLAPVLSSSSSQRDEGMAQPGDDIPDPRYRAGSMAIHWRWVTLGVALAGWSRDDLSLAPAVIGSEFLPHLDEGAIWVRGTLAPSTGQTEGARWRIRRAPFCARFRK
jgi:heavy metal efflux system protein